MHDTDELIYRHDSECKHDAVFAFRTSVVAPGVEALITYKIDQGVCRGPNTRASLLALAWREEEEEEEVKWWSQWRKYQTLEGYHERGH